MKRCWLHQVSDELTGVPLDSVLGPLDTTSPITHLHGFSSHYEADSI